MDMPSEHQHPGHANHGHHQHGGSAPDDKSALKDPVCGMTVTAQAEHQLEHEGRPYYFCSAKCRSKFAAAPEQFLATGETAPADSPPAAAGTIYTCPMHPEIRHDA